MRRRRVYDIGSLMELLENEGFEILESGSCFPKFLAAAQMEEILDKGILKDDIFYGFDQLGKYIPEYGSEIYVQVKRKE